MGKIIVKSWAKFVLFAGLLTLQSACDDDSGSAEVAQPVTPASVGEASCYLNGQTVTGATATACCDSSGNPRATLPAQCPQSPGFTGAKSAINGFAASAIAGRTALSAADGMVGSSGTGGLVGGSAATAADTLAQQANSSAKSAAMNTQAGGGGTSGTAAQLADDRSAGSGSGVRSGSGGGGASSAATGGGGLSGFSSGISTLAAVNPSGAAPAQAGPADGAAGNYVGAGGGGMRGGGRDNSDLFGGGSGAQGGRGQDSMGNLNRSPAGGPLGSQDPEDYFGMLKPTDNIFKVVERRYNEKASHWARSDAFSATQAVKKLSK